jgi:hypothetical protein
VTGSVAAEREREALLGAMARVVGARGYRAASVTEVIAEAESCRASCDKQECFLVAHERPVERTLEAASESLYPGQPWPERAICGLQTVLELCGEKPELARAALVEVAAAGAEGRRSALVAIERFAELIAPEPELALQLPPRATLMAMSGVAGGEPIPSRRHRLVRRSPVDAGWLGPGALTATAEI